MRKRGTVLVHGFLDSHRTPWWDRIEDFLNKHFKSVEIVNLGDIPGTTVNSPVRYAEEVAKCVDNMDYEEVDIISHSMGGVDSRWYIEQMGGDHKVNSLTTFGTPHKGTLAAHMGSFTQGGRDMRPDSYVINKLNEDGISDKIEYNSIWGTRDMLILPRSKAKLPNRENVTNVKLRCGHLRMVFSLNTFSDALRKADVLSI
jgi:triacylglycerol lipase